MAKGKDELPELFVDGISEATLLGGVVRIELMSLSPTERDAGGQPKAQPRQRVVMPLEGFLRSLAVQESLVRKLVDAGILKVNRPAEARQPAPAEDKPRVQ